MAKPPTMINEVLDLLSQGKTTAEITEETGCSKSTVTVARKRLGAYIDTQETNDATEGVNETDIDKSIDSFIKQIKIKPDQDVLTKDKVEIETTDYECPNCHHTWDAPKNEHQEICPSCELEFE